MRVTGYSITADSSSRLGPMELTLMYSDQAKYLKGCVNLGISFSAMDLSAAQPAKLLVSCPLQISSHSGPATSPFTFSSGCGIHSPGL